MNDAKHTPGPWLLEITDYGNEEPTFPSNITDSEGSWLCQFWSKQETDFVGHNPEEAMANARLIAAAPDMAEAIISQAKATADGFDAPLTDWEEYLSPEARAALRKAGIIEDVNTQG